MNPTKAEKEWEEFLAWLRIQAALERTQYFVDNFFADNTVNTLALPYALAHEFYFMRAMMALAKGEELEDENEG